MKKTISILLLMVGVSFCFLGCGKAEVVTVPYFPHDEKFTLDTPKEELIAAFDLVKEEVLGEEFYEMSDGGKVTINGYVFEPTFVDRGETLAGVYLQRRAERVYDAEYAEFVEFYTKLYGKPTETIKEGSSEYHDFRDTTAWEVDIDGTQYLIVVESYFSKMLESYGLSIYAGP